MNLIEKLKRWATSLKQKIVMLWFATKNPQTPWLPKVICIFIVAYALSPIDLIPDFIPILGFVDEIILLPMLIWVAIKLIPQSILDESLNQAKAWATQNQSKPKSLLGLLVVVIIWVFMIWMIYQLI
jgi:uncharacterized membrane protein YkvA (DUF1232 family)